MLKDLPSSLLMTEQNKIKKSELPEINQSILSKNNFCSTLEINDKDLDIFFLMSQSTDNNIINMIEFIAKKNEDFYDTKNVKINEKLPDFILKQMFLLFYYFSKIEIQNKIFYKEFENLYNNIYAILLKFYRSIKTLNFTDLFEICRFNIILGINNIKTKEYIFNSTIKCILNLNDFIEKNKESFEENIKTNISNYINIFFETLYLYLFNNKQSLIFLQRYEKIENVVLFKIYKFLSDDDKNPLNDLIIKIIILVYCFNYRKLINELLLREIQDSFCYLSMENTEKVCEQIRLLGTQIKIINNLYQKEMKFIEGDTYMPKNYFVFNESEQNGINYFPVCNIFENNFILIFSFKLKDFIEINYPLLTIISEDNKEILFNFSIQNKKINILYQDGHQETSNLLIQKNKTYLLIFEYIIDKDNKSKSFIIINDKTEKKTITSNIITCNKKNSILLGYLPHNIKILSKSLNDVQKNFIGLMGSVLIFPGIEKDIIGNEGNNNFASNLFKLKGFYNYLLYLTPNTDMQSLYKFENKNILYYKDYLSAKDYFNNNLNTLIKNCLIISPLSIFNCNDSNTKTFTSNIHYKNFKKMGGSPYISEGQYFTTIAVPSPYTEASFSKIFNNTLQGFVQNDGFSFLVLILEYYYNVLKMIFDKKNKLEFEDDNKYLISDRINKSICPIIDLITNIVDFFKIDCFNIEMDKYGFSLMKVINLLGDINPLSQELIFCFNKNIELLISSILKNQNIPQVSSFIRNFVNKYFTLICSPRYYDQNNEDYFILIFKLFSKIIANNDELIPIETSNLLTQFNFVLDSNSNSNEKSKLMKSQYKTLINQLILQNESIAFYSYFYFNIFQKNDSVKIKYKISKIYFKVFDENSLIRNYNENPENEEKIDSNTFWNLFKSQKKKDKNPFKDIETISLKYNNLLTKIIGIRYKYNNENERYHELIKCILTQLVYGQVLQYALKLNDEKIYFFSKEAIKQKKKDIFSQNKTRSRDASINKKSKTIKDNSGNISTYFSSLFSKGSSIDSGGKSSGGNPDSYFFDPLLIENNLSFYMYKSLFCCLFDNWDKFNKFTFIKNNNDIDNTNHPMFDIKNIGDFSKNKSELLCQLVELLSCIDDKKALTNSLKLIYIFLFKIIESYKLIPSMNVSQEIIDNCKKLFYSVFADKYVMNKLFTASINFTNDNITEEMSKYLRESITKLFNEILEYHPKPFIFNFIKTTIKNQNINKNLISILIDISEYIKINLKKDGDEVHSKKENKEINNSGKDANNINELNEINNYLLFNEIRFINCLKKSFLSNQYEAQKLLYETKFLLFNEIQSLVLTFCSSIYIYNTKLYILNIDKINQDFSLLNKNSNTSTTTNLDSYSTNSGSSQMSFASDKSLKEEDKILKNKNKEKLEIKILQNGVIKIINSQILVFDLCELSLIMIYLLWTLSCTEIKIKDVIFNFVKPFHEKLFIEQHYLTYYLDFANQKKINEKSSLIKEKIPPAIMEKIKQDIPNKYQHFILNNVCVDDSRFISVLVFLIMIKYYSLLNLYEKNKGSRSEKQLNDVKDLFIEILNFMQNDIFWVTLSCEKSKENKKLDIFFEKAELASKHFKDMQKYYIKFINSLNKVKYNLTKNTIENLKNEFTKKYIKEEEDKKKMKLNWEDKPTKTVIIKDTEIEDDNNDNDDSFILSNKNSKSFKTKKTVMLKNRKKNDNIEEEKDKDDEKNDKNNNQDNFINNNKDIANKSRNSYYFIDAEQPVLCTKRDIILKNFGYYFYCNYFKDKKFIQMQKYFLKLYPNANNLNNYGPFEKQMQLNYPTIIKNFNNCNNYYPRLFLQPDKKFWDNEYLMKSHEFLENFEKITKNFDNHEKNCENHMNLNYGHGLLGLNNFCLFSSVCDNESNSSLLYQYDCELIYNKNTIKGKIKLLKNFLVYISEVDFDLKEYFTEMKYLISSKKEEIRQKKKQIIIPYNLIEQIISRNFLFYSQAIELFLLNGKSYFFNLFSADNCTDILAKLKYIIDLKNNNSIEIISNQLEYFNKKKYTSSWQEGKITTFDYLLLINKFSNRSYNDLTQYLVMPWLLNNYTNIHNTNNFRKMNYSMAIQTKESLELIKQNYENDPEKRCYLQYHYSNSASISLYLIRLSPFSYNQIKLNGHFDSPDRQIESLQEMCNVLKDYKENNELIPEYFLMTECFLNINFNYYGKKKNELGNEGIVNNIQLTNQFSSLLDMIFFHQNFINSDEISNNINKWIDNIFGENQITTKKNIINSFPPECYEKNVKEEVEELKSQLREYLNNSDVDEKSKDKKKISIIKAIKLKIDYPYLFGQCPPQLFNRPHPCFYGAKKNRKESSDEFSKNDLLNINVDEFEELLYMNTKNGSINFYILTNNEIFIYNKSFKLINTLNICKINIPYSYIKDDEINDINKNVILRNIYKNLIIEIEDCKFFFIGGYLDNTFKIYYKEKDKEANFYSIATESQVTCIKNLTGKKIFFTGHRNGKILRWKYVIENNQVTKIKNIDSIIAHKNFVKIIEVNDKLNVIVSASDDGVIFIRKLFDYELLTVIKYNKVYKNILDFCFDKQVLITTYYDKNKKNVKINVYSLNGIKLSKFSDNIKSPITLISQTDEVILFIENYIFKTNIATFEQGNNVLNSKEFNNIGKIDDNVSCRFVDDVSQSKLISNFYDSNIHSWICLFNNGHLYRISLKVEDIK